MKKGFFFKYAISIGLLVIGLLTTFTSSTLSAQPSKHSENQETHNARSKPSKKQETHNAKSKSSKKQEILNVKSKSSKKQEILNVKTKPSKKEQEAVALGERAYIFGYPLVLMELTKEILTNVSAAKEETAAPINQLLNKTRFPDADFVGLVKPNVDTLYSTAFLDLSKEPMILKVPNTKERYYFIPLFDAWTNVFFSAGKRTTGTKEETFAITGPYWEGELPSNVREIKAPTNMIWLNGRIQTNGTADYRKVNAVQKAFKLMPLSAYGKDKPQPLPPLSPQPSKNNLESNIIAIQTHPTEQIEKMDAATFFAKLSSLMEKNPPSLADEKFIKKLSKIGIILGKKFDPDKISPEVMQGLEKSTSYALKKIKTIPNGGKIINGWVILTSSIGNYGTDYLQRARIAYMELGTNLPQDAVYPTTSTDSEGRLLNGKNKYIMQFSKDQLPAVKGFWSLSAYDERHLFSANPINRFAIGDRDKLKYNPDGSLTLYIQHESPGPEQEANWLPAPRGKFDLTLRLYWPKSLVLSGNWMPPTIKKINKKKGIVRNPLLTKR